MTKEETTEPRFKNVQEVLADPYFSGSITLTAKVPPQFAKAVFELHEQYNVKLVGTSDLDEKGFRNDNWKRVVVTGLKEDLIKLNKHCEKLAYGDVPYCR